TPALSNATAGSGKTAAAIANDRFTNTTSAPLTVTYNVTPVRGSCAGDAINIILTVQPEPVVSTTLNRTVCSDEISGITLATNGTSIAAASYTINTITVGAGLVPAVGNVTTGPG